MPNGLFFLKKDVEMGRKLENNGEILLDRSNLLYLVHRNEVIVLSTQKNRPQLSVADIEKVIEDSNIYRDQFIESYEISIVTPAIGEDLNKISDEDNHQFIPRESSIRGCLRFWWRATKGASCKDVTELREQEVAIFGDTSSPSAIKIWVEPVKESGNSDWTGKDKTPRHRNAGQSGRNKQRLNFRDFDYVLFPYRKKNSFPREFESFKFKLYIRYFIKTENPEELKKLKEEIHAALWAWINFGGIGSRTRRGCGSLYCPIFSPDYKVRSNKDFEHWFQKKLGEYQLHLLSAGESRPWPSLSNRLVVQTRRKALNWAWKEVVQAYKAFRRRSNEGKGSKGKPGRSHWPEADSIRKCTGMAEPLHKNSQTVSNNKEDIAFPRAQFGLPIIFQFKGEANRMRNERRKGNEREPFTTTLIPKGKERMASPLIIKAVAINEKEGFGAFILLNQPPIYELELKLTDSDNNAAMGSDHIRWIKERLKELKIGHDEIYPVLNYSRSPMKESETVMTSAIDAFLASEEVQSACNGSNKFNGKH